MSYIAVTYPGQSEEVRVGLGTTIWCMVTGVDHPLTMSLTWRSEPYPAQTHTPEEFLAAFPPRPGSGVERDAIDKGYI